MKIDSIVLRETQNSKAKAILIQLVKRLKHKVRQEVQVKSDQIVFTINSQLID